MSIAAPDSATRTTDSGGTRWRWYVMLGVFLAATTFVLFVLRSDSPWSANVRRVFASAEKAQQTASKGTATSDRLPDATSLAVGQGEVDVEGGVASLFPRQTGQVVEILVKEGQRVSAAAPLLRLYDEIPQRQARSAAVAVQNAELNLTKSERSSKEHATKIKLAEEAIAGAQLQLSIRERNLKTQREGGGAPEFVKASEEVVEAAKIELSSQQLKRKLLDLVVPAEDVKAARLALEEARNQETLAKANLANYTLKALEPGTVLRVFAAVGDFVGATSKQPPLVFRPDRPLLARCEIEQEFAGRAKVGMRAELRDDATGAVVGSGVVDRIGDWFAPRRLFVDDTRIRPEARTLECFVRIDAKPGEPLRIGLRLRVLLFNDGPAAP